MLLTGIAGWAPSSPGPPCCLPLASEGLEIKVGAWWLSLTAAGLVGQRMRKLELMTCYQSESHRCEQEGQSRILGRRELLFDTQSAVQSSTVQGLEGTVPVVGVGKLVLIRGSCGLS